MPGSVDTVRALTNTCSAFRELRAQAKTKVLAWRMPQGSKSI